MIQEIKRLWELGIDLIPAVKKNPKAGGAWGDREKMEWMAVVDKMTNEGFDSVAIRMGQKSGGLVALDIDEKYNAGFGVMFLGIIKDLMPELFKKLWIEQTPSGGFHVYWRVRLDVGTCNLVSREATREELLDKPKTSKYCFVELKGNGSLCTTYPTAGYKKICGDLNELTESEHVSILDLAKSFDTVPKYEPKKKYNVDDGYYSENPFECFDKSEAGSRVLDELGWVFVKSSGSFNWYGKPKSNGREVHATFNCKTGLYKIWGASVGEQKSYSPSNILCLLEFGEDKKKLYQWLVAKGYGKINPKVEENIIKKAAKSGASIPNNVSSDGKERLKEEKGKVKEKYPYGIFWKETEEGFKISRERLYLVAKELGFRKFQDEKVVFIDGHIVRKVLYDFFYRTMKEYIKEDNEDLFNCYEAFLQASGKFTITRLDDFDESMILSCEKYVSYLFYKNCYLRITGEEVETLDYSEMEKLIWEESIKTRDFVKYDGFRKGLYWQFLNNAIGCNDYLMQCIGHYAHNYRDGDAYCIVAVESFEKNGGGAGKNIFFNLFKEITTCMELDANTVSFDNSLLQSWDYERVIHISDLPKNFNLRFLNNVINGTTTVNKKYINEFKVPISKMPKIGCSTNHSYDDSQGGVDRRARAIEFSDYYKVRGGVNTVHGKNFPEHWDENDYICFDNTMVYAIQVFLLNNCKINKVESSFIAFKKQFEQKFTHLYDFIVLNLERYCELGNVETGVFMTDYKAFCLEENINIKFQYRSSRINEALEEYCIRMGFEFNKDAQWRDNSVRKTGKYFARKGAVKKEEPKEEEEYLPF